MGKVTSGRAVCARVRYLSLKVLKRAGDVEQGLGAGAHHRHRGAAQLGQIGGNVHR